MEQEDNPAKFVKPTLNEVDLYPNRLKQPAELLYVLATLTWDNLNFFNVTISDIKGTISVAGHQPADSFFVTNIINVRPFSVASEPLQIPINVTGEGLRIVQEMRRKGSGKIFITVDLNVRINDRLTQYEKIPCRVSYVG